MGIVVRFVVLIVGIALNVCCAYDESILVVYDACQKYYDKHLHSIIFVLASTELVGWDLILLCIC